MYPELPPHMYKKQFTKRFCHTEEFIDIILHNSRVLQPLSLHLPAAIRGHQPVKLLGGTFKNNYIAVIECYLIGTHHIFFSRFHNTIAELVTAIVRGRQRKRQRRGEE